ncbi:hypothetical protein K435DRAFT_489941 [Dendrothele bispora CBS 962.96]|uniref:Uncharacterized protein n=1 Tax=Dendrothele bispora (strain CBS 962.96) TaxID=1314807 RepID=A0A4S8KZ45_DENBC|nr:hypothetical protein K435DRAFT_489941 [Dendrothele bispora CBS 962.96]
MTWHLFFQSSFQPTQLIFRVLRHGLQGWDFPDLKWVIEGNRKTIIYRRTISLAFRLFVYYLNVLSGTLQSSTLPQDHVRFCCALFSTSYNTDSRNMFINNLVGEQESGMVVELGRIC